MLQKEVVESYKCDKIIDIQNNYPVSYIYTYIYHTRNINTKYIHYTSPAV